jgi:hypothetical protein
MEVLVAEALDEWVECTAQQEVRYLAVEGAQDD